VTFTQPLALVALVAVPLLLALWLYNERRRHASAARFSSLALLPNLVPRRPGRLRYVPLGLLLLALTAMIVGAGSVAFETILALVDRLPIMICPRWVSVETQPVAMADVLAVLAAVCGDEVAYDQTFDVGGLEVMTYRMMMERVARVRGRRPLLLEVPFLTPRLSSLWLYLVTPASVAVARPLVEGLRVPTVARDDRIWDLVGVQRTSFDEAILSALLEHD